MGRDRPTFRDIGTVRSKDVQRGWLTSETVVQLKFFNQALNIWNNSHKEKDFFIKVSFVSNMDTFQHWALLEVAVSYIWYSFYSP